MSLVSGDIPNLLCSDTVTSQLKEPFFEAFDADMIGQGKIKKQVDFAAVSR